MQLLGTVCLDESFEIIYLCCVWSQCWDRCCDVLCHCSCCSSVAGRGDGGQLCLPARSSSGLVHLLTSGGARIGTIVFWRTLASTLGIYLLLAATPVVCRLSVLQPAQSTPLQTFVGGQDKIR